ncbi:uncharacterized protein [Narcine bancroftii]|uniref:uncharacterized protein n=1 Tax=Narcine bancroftii TaxID=1343680 RepID=UPI0038316C23
MSPCHPIYLQPTYVVERWEDTHAKPGEERPNSLWTVPDWNPGPPAPLQCRAHHATPNQPAAAVEPAARRLRHLRRPPPPRNGATSDHRQCTPSLLLTCGSPRERGRMPAEGKRCVSCELHLASPSFRKKAPPARGRRFFFQWEFHRVVSQGVTSGACGRADSSSRPLYNDCLASQRDRGKFKVGIIMQAERNADPEAGTWVLIREREARRRDCFWPTLWVLSVLGLTALICFLLLSQWQETGDSQIRDLDTSATHHSLSRFMKQVGDDARGKTAAHLIASPTVKGKEVVWQDNVDSAFVEGVEFADNGLVIKTPGQYFVYTQVVFYHKGCQDKTIYLSHNISLHTESYEEDALLLKAIKSVCHYGRHPQHWYKSSYQGAIFQFHEGDQIFSRVSERVVQYVDSTMGKTFFGIFAL